MSDDEFGRLLAEHMCDDGPILDAAHAETRAARESLLEAESYARGFSDWVDAYHNTLWCEP